MKVRQLTVVMGVVAMLAACNGRRETTLTGSYGQSMLSGEVVMEGVRGGSPAGVEVSVRGTGMSMVVGEDGQFAFAGVADAADLDFRRAADGIEASLRVEANAGFITVGLGKAQATATKKKTSKRRGYGGSPTPIYEFEGVIRSAAADRIVVYTSHKVEQEIGLVAETIIRKGNTTLTPADLTVDTRVHVKTRKVADAYVAVLVIVQNPGDDGGEDAPPAVREYEGTVRSASATELVVYTSHKVEVTFTVNGDTVIRKGSTPVAAADLQIGWTVHVKATPGADGANATATLVIVQKTPAEAVSLEGTVASVGASSLVVTTPTGDVTVQTSASTQVRKGGKKISLSAIAVGDSVSVEGTRVDATTVQAKKITVES